MSDLALRPARSDHADVLRTATFSSAHRDIFHDGYDLYAAVSRVLGSCDHAHVAPLGTGAFSVCLLCYSGGIQTVLKIGALPEMLAHEAEALSLLRATNVYPHLIPQDRVPTLADLTKHPALHLSFLPGESLLSKEELGLPQLINLTDLAHEVWLAGALARPGITTIPDQAFSYARRTTWAKRRLTKSEPRPYAHLLDAVPTVAAGLSSFVAPQLCHGDFSPRNLLVTCSPSGAYYRSAYIIDPCPSFGDPIADLAHWVINAPHDPSGDYTEILINRLVLRHGVDEDRLRAWALLSAIIESNLAVTSSSAATGWLRTHHPAL